MQRIGKSTNTINISTIFRDLIKNQQILNDKQKMMQRTSLLLSATTTTFNRNFSRMTTLPMASTIPRASLLFNQQLQPQNLMTKCAFSGTQKCFSVAPELQEALRKEIKAEQEMEEDNLGGKTPPSISGFKITRDRAEFILTKMHGNERIRVIANINHSVDIDEVDEMEGIDESARSEEMQHDSVPVSLPPFRVEITKGDQRLVFYLQMMKSDSEGGYDYSIEEFMIAPAAKTTDQFEDVPEEVYSSSGKYIDPNLHELLFLRYLEERGITTQFCHDLVKFATHFEHQQYVELLEKLEKFVGGK